MRVTTTEYWKAAVFLRDYEMSRQISVLFRTLKRRMTRDYIWRAGDPCISCHLITIFIDACDLYEISRLDNNSM